MRTKKTRMMAALLCVTVPIGSLVLSGCHPKGDPNETIPLTIASEALDGVFNPFFYTAGADGEIVGQTQIGMLSSNEKGEPVAGMNEPCVTYDYSVVTTGNRELGDEYPDYYTDYYFAIKDGIQFADGVELTIKDVLFNIYMYLDPAYTGSSTMYSVDIVGLDAYRTQSQDKNEQQQFEGRFDKAAEARINAINLWAQDRNSTWESAGASVQQDIETAHKLFKDEIKSDWNNADGLLDTYKEKYGFEEPWEVFLYQYGLITVTTEYDLDKNKSYKVDYNGTKELNHDEETMREYAYEAMVGEYKSAPTSYKNNIINIINYYATAGTLRDYIVSDEITKYFQGSLKVRTVSGITVEKLDKLPQSNGTDKPLDKARDVLKIRINGVDPKAIQNFSFTVAPMHYYSRTADKFSLKAGEEYFGVEFGNNDFMKSVQTNQVPLGAGPYKASTADGGLTKDKTEFYKNGIVYFERNEHFLLGSPKIKKVTYQEISSTQMYDAVETKTVHFSMPNATQETMAKLTGNNKGLAYVTPENLGYGYIGVNAQYVNDINVRRAIMHAMDTSLCVEYYGGGTLASRIYRPMSRTLKDYYPEDSKEYYEFDGTGETSLQLVQDAGYELRGNVLTNSEGKTLKFTFTVAGNTEDHPAYKTMDKAAEILNKIGFDITVTKDSTALSKLSAGTLEVWAAAWSSSSDPDMYQVYHKNSKATSIRAWGYPYLLGANTGTAYEKQIIEDLATLIEQGRETTDKDERREIYSGTDGALDKVMELAVELPTYQRNSLYVYRSDLINGDTLTEASAYRSPISYIWNVEFKK